MGSRKEWFETIFGTTTPAGRRFDLILLMVILASVLTVLVESLPTLDPALRQILATLEWIFTGLFALEYGVRILVHPKPKSYALSFWGIVDLLSFLPSILSLAFPLYRYLVVVRLVRLLRIFRVLKLTRFLLESRVLFTAIKTSFYKISIFMLFMLILVVLLGSLMHVIEGGKNGFDSIPKSIYWAIITITTVGYGDIVPVSALGKTLAAFVMLTGYAILAVPTGIVTAELVRAHGKARLLPCPRCRHTNPDGSNFCNRCGEGLSKES